MKNLFLLLLLFSFSSLLFAQSGEGIYSIAEIEEYGIGLLDIKSPNNGDLRDSSLWASLADAPNPIGRPAYGVIGDYLFVFGGQNQTSQAVAYRISDNTWISSTPASAAGYNQSSCVAHGELYKMSGTGSVSVFEKFTPNTDGTGLWTTLASAPSALNNAQASIVYDNGDYIYASSADYATPTSSAFARYNLTSNTWETLTGSPNPKRYAGMAYLNGVIYLIGGLVPTGGDPVVCQKYDIATQSWGTIAPSLEALNFTKWSVSTDGRYVWLVGSGGGYSTYPSSNKVYYYDPIANSWQMESMLPAERGLALGLFLTGHNKLFFGGGNVGGSGTAFTNQCWEGTGGIYIPVELVSFSASANDGEVSLNWTTATETNNASFEIERSLDNIDYITISNLKGNGTTTEMHTYSFTDVVSISAKMFYRLKQIDFNGSFTYSKTIEVDVNTMPGDFVLSQNYPNPFNPSTTIKYSVSKIINNQSSIINLKVYDALGNEVATLVNEEKSPGNYEVEWTATGFASGVYFYRLKAGDFNSVKKLVLMK